MRSFTLAFAALAVVAIFAPTVSAAAPSVSCDRERQACMSGSARTGTYGERYVPPDDAARCHEAYRACVGRR